MHSVAPWQVKRLAKTLISLELEHGADIDATAWTKAKRLANSLQNEKSRNQYVTWYARDSNAMNHLDQSR